MILDKSKGISCVIASRFEKINPLSSFWDAGNFFFTKLFNYIYKTSILDALCCAKSFFKTDINILSLKANKFDIDVEITSKLVLALKNIKQVHLKYTRRKSNEGKKLKITDGFKILILIFANRT